MEDDIRISIEITSQPVAILFCLSLFLMSPYIQLEIEQEVLIKEIEGLHPPLIFPKTFLRRYLI
jgi:hypothetical protein